MKTWREVFWAFLKLGLTSFGGPAAHVGYFRQAFVEQRQWLDESQFAQLLAISQFLPGPASSQLGYAIGLHRAGWQGALAAFIAFTTPSVMLLIAFAAILPLLQQAYAAPVLHGLKLVAVAVVGYGVLGMVKGLLPDLLRRAIAVLAVVIMIMMDSGWGQMLVIVMGAVLGLLTLHSQPASQVAQINVPVPILVAKGLLALFVLLLVLAFMLSTDSELQALVASYYRSGALVFGGGHVVLPLLDQAVVIPGWVSEGDFMAGYGAAQAVPGPMFSLAAFLGYVQGGLTFACLAVLAIFLPGFLLLTGVLPYWHRITKHTWSGRLLAGDDAAVVGWWAATLSVPLAPSALLHGTDWRIALAAFALLQWAAANAVSVVIFCVLANSLVAYFI